REEVDAYVTHRLWVARGSTSVTFTPKAFDLVHAITGGVPRMINLVCDRSLMVGSEQKTSKITEDHVVGAAAQLSLEIPKGKIKGEHVATPDSAVASKRSMLVAGSLAVIAAIAVAAWLLGNPIDLMSSGPSPTIRPLTTRALPSKLAALPATDLPQPSVVPPPIADSFSIVIGTYDNEPEATRAEARLKANKLAPYTVDVLVAPNDLRRRVLIGRYRTRADADAALATLGPNYANSKVIFGWQERFRLLVP
ncbi:MAG TPA: SPOR domain-containing protein, partial [Vicinamibacterales bacterium]